MRAFRWTPLRRKIVELLMRGVPYVHIARELGIHRNTVRNLVKREEVQQRLARKITEYALRRKLRAIFVMTTATDAAARVAFIQLREAQREAERRNVPTLPTTRRACMAVKMFRKQARATRKELEAIDRIGQVETREATRTIAHLLRTKPDSAPKPSRPRQEATGASGARKARSMRRKRLERRPDRL